MTSETRMYLQRVDAIFAAEVMAAAADALSEDGALHEQNRESVRG